MSFITTIKNNFQKYILAKNIKKSTFFKAVNFKNAEKIAIIYKASHSNDRKIKEIREMFNTSGKKLYMLGYIHKNLDNYLPATYMGSYIFTDKDLNIFNTPKSSRISEFVNNEYDILINLSDNKCYPVSYISSICKASLKIGFYSPDFTSMFDIMIDSGKINDIDNFTKQLKQFIHLIDKK